MKKLIGILLTLLMLLTLVCTVTADDDTVDLVTFNQISDFDGWQRRTYPVTDSHKSQEAVRVGSYSLKMIDFDTEHTWTLNSNKSTDGMSYINMWLYCDNPNNVTIDFRPKIGGNDVLTAWTIPLDFKGWKLVTFPLAGRSGTISKISFSTYGYGFGARGGSSSYPDNTTAKLQATTLYLNHMWLSKEEPADSVSYGGSSVKDGAEFVKHNLSKIAIEAPGVSESAAELGSVTVEPEAKFHTEISAGYVNVYFEEDLTFATDYSITLGDGFFNKDGIQFEEKTISFKTRGENDNIPPDVELIAPESGSRFSPGDTVTLTANASDEDGSIAYVEFYCDGALIEGSRTYSNNGEFTYNWQNVKENLSGNTITAMARDNSGKEEFSDGVRIRIAGNHNPTVTIESPVKGTSLSSSISGIKQPISLDIKTLESDIDGEVSAVYFYLDGSLLNTETENTASASFTFDGSLDPGEHIFSVIAEDNDALTAEAAVSVNVKELGKAFPELTVKGTDNDYMMRKCSKKLEGFIWQIDTQFVINDSKAHDFILVGSSNYTLLNFAPDGTVTAAGKAVDVPKRADGVYDVSVIVLPQNTVCYCVLNGETVISDMTVSGFSTGATVRLENADRDTAYIEKCSFYKLDEAANLSDLTVFDADGNVIEDMSEADIYTDSILIEFENGISEGTVDGNVSFVDKITREILPSKYKNGKTYILSKLKSDYEYLLRIGSDISDVNNRGLGGDKIFEIKTKKNPVTVTYDSPMTAIDKDTTAVYVDVTVKNNTDTAQKCDIVSVVYDGNAMKQNYIESVELAPGAKKTKTLLYSLDNEVTEKTYVETFAVDSTETIKPVSDSIFRLTYKD